MVHGMQRRKPIPRPDPQAPQEGAKETLKRLLHTRQDTDITLAHRDTADEGIRSTRALVKEEENSKKLSEDVLNLQRELAVLNTNLLSLRATIRYMLWISTSFAQTSCCSLAAHQALTISSICLRRLGGKHGDLHTV